VVEAGAVGLAVWASAVMTGRVLQLGAGLTIGLAVVVAGVVQLVAERVSASVVRAARNRRRGTRDGQGPWIPPDTSVEAELLGLLKLARTALVEAVAARPRRSRLAGLVVAVMTYLWLHGYGRRRYWIGTAERRLCQSIAATHRWLAAVQEAQ